jgi:hypothetical protein
MTDDRDPPSPDDNAVGYGRPPKHSQFKPRHSGNPKGRAKGSKNFSTLFSEELMRTISFTENGKRFRMPKCQLLAKQTINKALDNDHKSKALVFDQIRHGERATDSPVTIEVERPENKLVMESIIRRIRASVDAPSETTGPKDDSDGSK